MVILMQSKFAIYYNNLVLSSNFNEMYKRFLSMESRGVSQCYDGDNIYFNDDIYQGQYLQKTIFIVLVTD